MDYVYTTEEEYNELNVVGSMPDICAKCGCNRVDITYQPNGVPHGAVWYEIWDYPRELLIIKCFSCNCHWLRACVATEKIITSDDVIYGGGHDFYK